MFLFDCSVKNGFVQKEVVKIFCAGPVGKKARASRRAGLLWYGASLGAAGTEKKYPDEETCDDREEIVQRHARMVVMD